MTRREDSAPDRVVTDGVFFPSFLPYSSEDHAALEKALRMMPSGFGRPVRQQRPRLAKLIRDAEKLGVTSITTDGVTYAIGQAADSEQDDPAEREIARLRALRGTR
jgi:hypothetical protein